MGAADERPAAVVDLPVGGGIPPLSRVPMSVTLKSTLAVSLRRSVM
jgi:hypothetical protein